jgi:16S rRNA (guanine966-N2)-methyltransferase
MTRVIAGAARGRRLAVPPGRHTRPTSDRAREGLFSTLESLRGSLAGARVLDLYAGSGAVGIEALSRGAAHALLVESDPRAVAVLRANVATAKVAGAALDVTPVERLTAQRPAGTAHDAADGPSYRDSYDSPHETAVLAPYDIVFVDPPYTVSDSSVGGVLAAALAHGWIADGAIVVVERATRGGEFSWPGGFVADRSRRYGEATLWYGRAGRRVQEADPEAQPAAPVRALPPEQGD